MERREFMKTMGLGAAALLLPWSAGETSAFSIRKAAPRWRGFNLLNYFTAGYTEPFREEEFQWIHDWGFNFVRIPLSYWNWSKPAEYYQMDEKVLEDIDRCVAWGKKYHIHVCLNLHRAPGYCVNPPAEPENIFRDQSALDGCAYQWEVFAKRYAKESNKWLSFNLLNEVANVSPEDYERVVRRLVSAIRKYNPDRMIMIDGLDWGGRPLMLVDDLRNIVQCGRGYQPMVISHYEASWVFKDKMWIPREQLTWPLRDGNNYYDKDFLRRTLKDAWTPMLEKGRHQLFIGEFGAHNRTPHAATLAWLGDLLDVFSELNLGWTLWNLRGSFGILDSGRDDVEYEDFHGHKLDRKMLEVLREHM